MCTRVALSATMTLLTKKLGLGALLLSGLVGFACQPKTDAEPGDGPTTPDASTDAETGKGPDGGNAELPKPVFCPIADPFKPTGNAVVVSDTVLKEDTKWTADKVYLIGDDFKIQKYKLTVEAGTTICLYQRGRILVGQGIDPGEIHLDGTADKPIVITAPPSASDPTKPDVFHRGLQFDTYLGSSISYVNIWYGGPGGGSAAWAFELTNTARGNDAKKPLLVDHVVVGAVQSKGVRVGTENGVADGSSIQFTGFAARGSDAPALDATAEVDIMAVKSFGKAWKMAGASIPDGAKHVNLKPNASDGRVSADAELVDLGLPFLYKNHRELHIVGPQNDPVGATLTIREGVTLKMDGVLIVGATSGTAQGNLVVAGTKEKPVTFTSTQEKPTAGDWEGFYFVGGQYDPAKTKIDNAKILYAGVDGSNGQQVNHHVGRCGGNFVGAVMIVDGSRAPYQGPQIANTHIAFSKSDGIVSDANDSGGHVATNYAKPDITFEAVAGKTLANNGACN